MLEQGDGTTSVTFRKINQAATCGHSRLDPQLKTNLSKRYSLNLEEREGKKRRQLREPQECDSRV